MVKGTSKKKIPLKERLPGIIQGIKLKIRKKKQWINIIHSFYLLIRGYLLQRLL